MSQYQSEFVLAKVHLIEQKNNFLTDTFLTIDDLCKAFNLRTQNKIKNILFKGECELFAQI
jgi:hypothetical protein